MTILQILKNGKVIREFKCQPDRLQKWFEYVHTIAGGLWNGKDDFKVIVK